jgi:hypothetical protein
VLKWREGERGMDWFETMAWVESLIKYSHVSEKESGLGSIIRLHSNSL